MLRLLALCLGMVGGSLAAVEPPPLRLLFLGDNGPHRPADRAAQLAPALAARNIHVEYTDDPSVLKRETLREFDGLILYANIDAIEPGQADALLEYVASGKGFIPLHCASYCFRNDERIVALMGGQFLRHGGEEFSTQIAAPDHPVLRGFGGFRSWDETYIHHRHNARDRTILEYRAAGDQADGNTREPWTWVRTHGQGRVFYTAWGHDERTWTHPGFVNLVERGVRWACGGDPAVVPPYRDPNRFDVPAMTTISADVAPFEYIDVGAKIPHYLPDAKWGTQGEPLTRMQQPLPPGESVKHFVTPTGFETQLYAAEPDLGGKPIAMTWDERGRLWVCETYDYPNELQPRGQGRDRIRICEDTDGDGCADRFTLFAEGLSIPTAIACCRGGAVVQDGTETVFLKDTDGDGRADQRTVLITGWALGDTHGGVSNFQYGHDNWIWGMQGYNNSTPVIGGVEQPSFRMGFFRFLLDHNDPPQVTSLEFCRSTDNNTWGIGFSEEGIVFGSTANHNPSVYMPIPNRYYERVRGWGPEQLGTIADTYLFRAATDKIRQVDQFGGYTAGAGHALYTGRAYPQQWWNRTAFVCEPTGHLVGTFVLSGSGADFQSTSPLNLVASDDEWSAPIMAEVGPDGQVWVLDWYNYIVQHNPTPQGFQTGKGNAYESDLRDKRHGRIYRVVYHGDQPGGEASAADLSLDAADPQALLANLRNPTMLVRKHAQRLLVERRNPDVREALIDLVRDPSVDEIGLNVGAIHALWTLHGLGELDRSAGPAFAAVVAALRHPSAGVRRNAIQVLPFAPESLQALLQAGVVDDPDAQVQLAATLALADMPAGEGIGSTVAGRILDEVGVMSDRWLRDAATSAACVHALPFFESLVAAGQLPCAPASPLPESPVWIVVERAAEHVARGRPSAAVVDQLVGILARGDDSFCQAALAGLSAGWPKDHPVSLKPRSEAALVALLERLPAGSQGELIRLAGLWGSRELEQHAGKIVAALLAVIDDDDSDQEVRIASARQLVTFRSADPAIVTGVLDAVDPQTPPELAAGLIGALSACTAANLGSELVGRARSLTPGAREAALRVLMARPATTAAFLDGVEEGKVQLADLQLDQRQALSVHPDRGLRDRARALLKAGGGLPNPDRDKVLQELLPLAEKTGDVALGKEVFKKQCAKCHRHSGEGETIGPDLTGMAVHPRQELLMHLIDPSRSVEGNFRVYTVLTEDGLVLTGMLASESRTSIELVDSNAKRQTIPREDIDEIVVSTKSLMPEGFEKQVSPEEIVNLLEFLAHRGKYIPLDLRKVATVVSTRGMFFDANGEVERLVFPDWSPKTFRGVPFLLVDPQGDRVPNVVMLHGTNGDRGPRMPRSVALPINVPARAIHFLSGIGGWSWPAFREKTVTLIVRLHYADGAAEDHELRNGEHFADYIRRVDVPQSEFAFALRGQQVRYFAIEPRRTETIRELELVKGNDPTVPVVMALTVESP